MATAPSLRESAASSDGTSKNSKGKSLTTSDSTLDGGALRSASGLDDAAVKHERTSKRSRKTVMGEKLRQVAMFANNIAMEDEDALQSDHGGDKTFGPGAEVDDEHANETGTQRLKRALTTETKQKGLFRYTNTLGSAVGIEPDVLMRVALEDEWQMVSCASLPFTIIFFVIFMFFFQLHYGVTDIYLAEAALRNKLGKPATQLNEAIQIYDWLENDYFPFLWAAKTDANFAFQLNSPSLYQELIAGVRISTTLAKKERCSDDLVNNLDCFNEFVDTDMSGAGVFTRRLKEANDGSKDADSAKFDGTLLDETKKVVKRVEEIETVVPKWAKPGLSEGWMNFKKKQAQAQKLSLELPQRKRTAEAHDWCDTTSVRTKKIGSRPSLDPSQSRPSLDPSLRKTSHGREKRREKITTRDSQHLENVLDRRLRINRPEIRPLTPRPDEGNRSEIVIPISWSLNDVVAEVQRWKTNRVIDEQTLTFGAEALISNKNLGHDLLSSVIIDFSIHRGGNVFTEVKIVTLVTSSITSDMIQLGMGTLWVICLLGFSILLICRAGMRWKQGKLRAHFLRFWNLLEWGIILWGWMVFFMFLGERFTVMALNSDIEDYQESRKTVAAANLVATDVSALKDFLSTSNGLIDLSMWTQMFVALYHIILVCRFFLASRGQPRLAVVLSTIRKASVDLGHLFIVFMIIFIAYVVSGHILFGRRIQEFATFQGAFARCFQIVMEREYTWAEFTEEDLWTATIWVWSFLLLVVLVLVNIFLAMIFDTYGDVRSSVGHSATLWQTTKIVFTHFKHTFGLGDASTRWVANRELVQAVKAMQCQYVTPWMVKDAFPGISNKQVNYIFNLGKNRLETMLLRGNKSSLPAVIASILLGVERMHQGLQMMQGNSHAAAKKKGVASESSLSAVEETSKETPPAIAKMESQEAKVGVSMEPPADPPPWLKVQLIPHFQKQKNLLTQVHVQIQRIERAMQQRGLGPGLGPAPGTTPRSLKARGALGNPGAMLLPYGPSTATSGAGMLPAALRAGLTASGDDRPLAEPVSLRQPGG